MFTCFETEFYRFRTKYVRKYWLFGEKVRVPNFELLFTLVMNIESPLYTAKEVREKIRKELGTFKRLQEIEQGKII
jgi:subtilase family serine protease